MFDLIEKLREKPNNVKKRIAFSSSLVFSSLVFAVWFTVIYPDIKNKNIVISETSSSTPADTLSGFISDGFSQMKGKISEVANAFSSLASSTSVYYATSSTPQNNDKIMEESTTTESYLGGENE